jgi:hypothetical protein
MVRCPRIPHGEEVDEHDPTYADQKQLAGYRAVLFFPGMSQGEATRLLRGIGWRTSDEL